MRPAITAVVDFCRDQGVIVGRAGGGRRFGNVIVLSPPLVITRAECDRLVDTQFSSISTPSSPSSCLQLLQPVGDRSGRADQHGALQRLLVGHRRQPPRRRRAPFGAVHAGALRRIGQQRRLLADRNGSGSAPPRPAPGSVARCRRARAGTRRRRRRARTGCQRLAIGADTAARSPRRSRSAPRRKSAGPACRSIRTCRHWSPRPGSAASVADTASASPRTFSNR